MGMSKKKELEKRMFAHRDALKDFAEGRYDKPKVETVSASEIVDFLQRSAEGHARLYRYTKINRIEEMLESKRLCFSRLLEMNDLREYKNVDDANRTYIACFSFGNLENMAMWKMYGGDDNKSVRVSFDNKRVVEWVKGLKAKKHFYRDSEIKETIDVNQIESITFHDIAYAYGKALMWNHKVVGMSRCRELEKPFEIRELQGYIKDFGWASENEVRIIVKLKKCDPKLKRIFADFSSVINTMEVLSGPVNDKFQKIKGLMSMYDIIRVDNSKASVIF